MYFLVLFLVRHRGKDTPAAISTSSSKFLFSTYHSLEGTRTPESMVNLWSGPENVQLEPGMSCARKQKVCKDTRDGVDRIQELAKGAPTAQ